MRILSNQATRVLTMAAALLAVWTGVSQAAALEIESSALSLSGDRSLQRFVGEWVEKSPELAFLIESPREKPVKRIRQHREKEDAERGRS